LKKYSEIAKETLFQGAPEETFEKDENFNRRNTLSILRIKI